MSRKWNDGIGAIICDICSTVIRYGWTKDDLKVHICDDCQTEWAEEEEEDE